MAKYYFLHTKEINGQRKIFPIKGQTLENGDDIDAGLYVAADKELHYAYPEDTVWGTDRLILINTTNYSAGKIYPLNAASYLRPDHQPAMQMSEAWAAFSEDADLSYDGEEEKAEPTGADGRTVITPKETLKEKILKSYRRPSIDKDGFYVSEDTWLVLARNIIKGVNTLLVGPSGTGKTELVQEAARQLGYQLCTYDMGSMHDPMTQMLGTHRIDADHKSTFDYARFVYDISEAPSEGFAGKIILLDELSRAPLNTLNILLPCLDSRRMLPVEMAGGRDCRSVAVNENVVFVATANVGAEYTGTNSMDKALVSRFFTRELGYMPADDEAKVLRKRTGILAAEAKNIVRICSRIRDLYSRSEVGCDVSTREALRVADMVADGFTVTESLTSVILPMFEGTDNDGERSTVKKLFLSC